VDCNAIFTKAIIYSNRIVVHWTTYQDDFYNCYVMTQPEILQDTNVSIAIDTGSATGFLALEKVVTDVMFDTDHCVCDIPVDEDNSLVSKQFTIYLGPTATVKAGDTIPIQSFASECNNVMVVGEERAYDAILRIPYCNDIPFNETSTVCNGNGDCLIDGECTCNDGYNGTWCNEFSCDGYPSTLEINTREGCSDHGTCSSLNLCACDHPYVGQYCGDELIFCDDKGVNHTEVCGGVGNCTDSDVCVCNEGYTGDYCEIFGDLENLGIQVAFINLCLILIICMILM